MGLEFTNQHEPNEQLPSSGGKNPLAANLIASDYWMPQGALQRSNGNLLKAQNYLSLQPGVEAVTMPTLDGRNLKPSVALLPNIDLAPEMLSPLKPPAFPEAPPLLRQAGNESTVTPQDSALQRPVPQESAPQPSTQQDPLQQILALAQQLLTQLCSGQPGQEHAAIQQIMGYMQRFLTSLRSAEPNSQDPGQESTAQQSPEPQPSAPQTTTTQTTTPRLAAAESPGLPGSPPQDPALQILSTQQSGESIESIPTLHTDQVANENDQTPNNDAKAVDLYETTSRSVVKIEGTKTFRNQKGVDEELPVTGTGFFVTADGELATDNHVVQGLHNIKVTTADGKTTYDAVVDSFNNNDDVALMTLQRKNEFEFFVPLALSKNSNLEKGQQVMAVGNPAFLQADGSYKLSPQNRAFMSPGTFEDPHTLADLTKDIVDDERAAIIGQENVKRTLLQTAQHTEGGDSGAPLMANDGTVVGIVDYYSKYAPKKREITESTPVEDIAHLLDRTRQLRSRATYGMTALDLSNDPGVNVTVDNNSSPSV